MLPTLTCVVVNRTSADMSNPRLHVTILRLDEYDDVEYHEVPIIQLQSSSTSESRCTGVGHVRKGGDGYVFEKEKDTANIPLVFEYDPKSSMQLSVQINKKDVGTKLVSTAPGVALIDVPPLESLSRGEVIGIEIKEDDD